MNALHRLHVVAKRHLEKTAVASVDGEMTDAELYAEVDSVANVLRDAGIGPGDCCVVFANSSNQMLTVLLAGWQLGAIPPPINTRLDNETVQSLATEVDT